jgi:hypothetical protein
MFATVVLCVLSTSVFCICLRLAVGVLSSPKPLMAFQSNGFNLRTRRMIRSYLIFSLSTLGMLALGGAVHAYIELFQFRF